jgi:hypothetical protein
VARQHAEAQGIKYKQNFDYTTAPHNFKIDQKVWLSDTTALGKNPKLTPKWLGPYKIVDLNDNNAKLEIKANKFKVVNCSRLKPFLDNKHTGVCPEENRLPQGDPSLFQDTNTDITNRPLTRALKKLIDYKNAATMAISLLQDDFECPFTFTKNYTQFCCDKCYNAFKHMDFTKDPNVCEKHKNLINFAPTQKARDNSHCALIKNIKYCKNDADPAKNDADLIKISAIKEELRLKLTSIASKLLSSEHYQFSHLSEEEQHLWRQFDKEEIYKFITGEEDTLPEFQYNWIEPCQLAVHLSPELQRFFQDLRVPPDQQKAPVQLPPAPPVPPPPQVQQAAPPAPVAPPPPAQDHHQVPGPSGLQTSANQHDLRPKKAVDYKELHTGVKQRCRKLRRQAKAVVTKLAPGAFSPKQPPPDSSSSQGPSS